MGPNQIRKCVLVVSFAISSLTYYKVQGRGLEEYTLEARWVPEIEEAKKYVPPSEEVDSPKPITHVCEDHKHSSLIAWCDAAMRIFAKLYPCGTLRFEPNPRMKSAVWYEIKEEDYKHQKKKEYVRACQCPLIGWLIYLADDSPSDNTIVAIVKIPKYLTAVEPEDSSSDDERTKFIRRRGPGSSSKGAHRHHSPNNRNKNKAIACAAAEASTSGQQGQNICSALSNRCNNCMQGAKTGCNNCIQGAKTGCSNCCDGCFGCLAEVCRPSPYSYRSGPLTQGDLNAAFWDGWMMNNICSFFISCAGFLCENMGAIFEHCGNNMEQSTNCIAEVCGVFCSDAGCCLECIGHLCAPP